MTQNNSTNYTNSAKLTLKVRDTNLRSPDELFSVARMTCVVQLRFQGVHQVYEVPISDPSTAQDFLNCWPKVFALYLPFLSLT
jgi:hypothetical protein